MPIAAVKCAAVILSHVSAADRKVVIKIKTSKLAGGGISTALCLIMLFLSSFVPNLKIAFLFASSITVGICILKYKLGVSLICFIAASLLSLFILPNKFVSLAFFVLFGNYPIVKLYIEKLKNIVFEYILKFIAANIYMFLIYVVLKALGEQAFFDFSPYILYTAGIVLLLFYDLAFGFVINAFYKSYYKYLK